MNHESKKSAEFKFSTFSFFTIIGSIVMLSTALIFSMLTEQLLRQKNEALIEFSQYLLVAGNDPSTDLEYATAEEANAIAEKLGIAIPYPDLVQGGKEQK